MKKISGILALLLCLALVGCGKAEPEGGRMMNIAASVEAEGGTERCFTLAALEGNVADNLRYGPGVSQVTIPLNGKSLPLEVALEHGDVTLNQILYAAREDSAKGLCQAADESDNGLRLSVFSYPEYDLAIIDDILEPPTGEDRHIQFLSLRRPGQGGLPARSLRDRETGLLVDMEDWGLSFQTKDVTAEGLTLVCSQSGGQQLGVLSLALDCITQGKKSLEIQQKPELLLLGDLEMEGQREFTVSWKESLGSLASGEYVLEMVVTEGPGRDNVHPLTQDFHAIQDYAISFQVP